MFCVKKDDHRWQAMCSNPLSKCVRDRLLGDEECKSPFGTYELQIPVDNQLSCTSDGITDKNCKDLDVSTIGIGINTSRSVSDRATKISELNIERAWHYYLSEEI